LEHVLLATLGAQRDLRVLQVDFHDGEGVRAALAAFAGVGFGCGLVGDERQVRGLGAHCQRAFFGMTDGSPHDGQCRVWPTLTGTSGTNIEPSSPLVCSHGRHVSA
jgi:hypothetical protein